MKYDSEIGFGLFIMSIFFVIGLLIWVYGWYKSVVESETAKETLKNLKDIFWTNTPMGWVWRELFGKNIKSKQAPPHLTNQFGHQIPMTAPPPPGPKPLTAKKAAPKGTLYTPIPSQTYNTSSLHRSPHLIGKPLVIQNWDRLAGMAFPLLGRNWIVTRAIHSSYGYECVIESSLTHKLVGLIVYTDMYDSHRVMVKCGGRSAFMDIDSFKDPNKMLRTIATEFQEKFIQ